MRRPDHCEECFFDEESGELVECGPCGGRYEVAAVEFRAGVLSPAAGFEDRDWDHVRDVARAR